MEERQVMKVNVGTVTAEIVLRDNEDALDGESFDLAWHDVVSDHRGTESFDDAATALARLAAVVACGGQSNHTLALTEDAATFAAESANRFFRDAVA